MPAQTATPTQEKELGDLGGLTKNEGDMPPLGDENRHTAKLPELGGLDAANADWAPAINAALADAPALADGWGEV